MIPELIDNGDYPAPGPWRRCRIRDRRIRHGDDFAGDAWVNARGDIRYTVVGFDYNELPRSFQ